MVMTKEQQEIYDGLSDYHKTVMGYTHIIMKNTYKGMICKEFLPPWMQEKIDYLAANGFPVVKVESKNSITVESNISNATFEQKLRIWDIQQDK